jgi:hypothetical protein
MGVGAAAPKTLAGGHASRSANKQATFGVRNSACKIFIDDSVVRSGYVFFT